MKDRSTGSGGAPDKSGEYNVAGNEFGGIGQGTTARHI
jgi:hypothetical protein|tara:strand:- start:155 stop:268 length:114 start_codon:yes stop_codon:yes gene_type:complete